MNFAERMSRLGTESAFEVLARAKALERQGLNESARNAMTRRRPPPSHPS